MKSKRDITKTIEMPEGVSASYADGDLTVKGPKGEVSRNVFHPELNVSTEGNKVVLGSDKRSKNQKRMINSTAAHIKNMVVGVTEGHTYKLKVCSSHFPMNVAVKNNVMEVKNFIGEKQARHLTIKEGVTVKVQGQDVTVESADIEKAGTVASAIEQICRITNKDRRIFQDGIYIVAKAK